MASPSAWRGCFEACTHIELGMTRHVQYHPDDEYRIAAQTFSLSAGDLEKLDLNALRAAFLPPEQKAALEAEFPGAVYQLTPTVSGL